MITASEVAPETLGSDAKQIRIVSQSLPEPAFATNKEEMRWNNTVGLLPAAEALEDDGVRGEAMQSEAIQCEPTDFSKKVKSN